MGPKRLHFRLVPPLPGDSGAKWAQGHHFQSCHSVGLSPPGRLWLGGLNPRDSDSVGPREGRICQLGCNKHPGAGAGLYPAHQGHTFIHWVSHETSPQANSPAITPPNMAVVFPSLPPLPTHGRIKMDKKPELSQNMQ